MNPDTPVLGKNSSHQKILENFGVVGLPLVLED